MLNKGLIVIVAGSLMFGGCVLTAKKQSEVMPLSGSGEGVDTKSLVSEKPATETAVVMPKPKAEIGTSDVDLDRAVTRIGTAILDLDKDAGVVESSLKDLPFKLNR